ncbi:MULTISPECIES: nuclear transport factor 2 family protein [unclassified Bradyrhizobium]|uniref:nuclear transport factor 2 family protein n=1 Tax=unclassified Bradyrhizobium TaxID=2631580 RepID=UPI00339A8DCE
MKVETLLPDSALTREQIIERNLRAVEAHFHNENPEHIDEAIALYADKVTWEAPNRGIVMTDKSEILKAYHGIFRSVVYHRTTPIRRFATETFVFDDQVSVATLVGDEMPNVPFPIGTRMSVRLTHVFQMKDGKIEREIAYEMFRKDGAVNDHDFIPDNSMTITFPEGDAAVVTRLK